MPREYPHREIEPKSTAEPSYTRKEHELEQTKGIKNTRPWTGVEKVPVTLTPDVMKQYSDRASIAIAQLKKLADFGGVMGGARVAEPLKQITYTLRGDLPGYWNDLKQELASRSGVTGNTQADASLNTTLDWLELAERQGGLGTWLEQWNNMLSSPWSWDMIADSVDRVKQGIEFSKEVVREGFGDYNALGDEQRRNRTDLLNALDAIASEITRQADQIFGGNGRLDLGRPQNAVAERMKDVSTLTAKSARLHTAIEKGNLSQVLVREMPDAVRQIDKTGDLANSLKDWEKATAELHEAVNASHLEEDETDGVDALGPICAQIHDTIEDLGRKLTSPTQPHDPNEVSIAFHIYRQVVKDILDQHEQLSKQLSSPDARASLAKTGALLKRLSSLETSEPANSPYTRAHQFHEELKLDDYWLATKNGLDKAMRTSGNALYNPGLADKFSQAVGKNLENLLAQWAARNDLSLAVRVGARLGIPVNTGNREEANVTLAWELIATLRNLKQRSETLLAGIPTQKNLVVSILDSIAREVANDAQGDANPAR